jgi:hypothetical protein
MLSMTYSLVCRYLCPEMGLILLPVDALPSLIALALLDFLHNVSYVPVEAIKQSLLDR